MLIEKSCSKCGLLLALSDFPKSGGKGGHSSWCRACHHARYATKKAAEKDEAMAAVIGFDPMGDLIAAREKSGTTIREIAQKVGVAETNVSAWFLRKKAPRQRNLRALYEVLGVELPMALKPGDGGRMPLSVASCKSCGAAFPVYKAGVAFCSKACSGKDLSRRQVGAANSMWKGGETVTTHNGGGYIKELCPSHPKGDASGYVLQHRLVMERLIGRALKDSERVHHKNGKRDDNRPENLELWTGIGSSKKDPAGIRVVDQVLDLLSSLTAEERLRVAERLQQLDPV